MTSSEIITWLQNFTNKNLVIKLGNQIECTIDEMVYDGLNDELVIVINPEQDVKFTNHKYEMNNHYAGNASSGSNMINGEWTGNPPDCGMW